MNEDLRKLLRIGFLGGVGKQSDAWIADRVATHYRSGFLTNDDVTEISNLVAAQHAESEEAEVTESVE